MDRSLKILHLFDFYLPNTMNWAHQMMHHTPEVEQWVAAPWMLRNEFFDPNFRFFVRDLQRLPGCLPRDEWAVPWLSTNLIRLERRYPLYKNWLLGQLKNNPPDLLHAHFGPIGCHYLELAQRLDIPLVVSFYGFDFLRLPFEKPIYQQRYRQLFAEAAAITTTGPFTPKFLTDQGCPPEKITPIPLSIAPDRFSWIARKKFPGQLRMVQIATITGKKGYMDTLEAFRLALPTCPNAHLTIAGEHQDQALVRKMRDYIACNHLETQITWGNALPHDTLPEFMGQFDVFVHPSCLTANQDTEGSPVVILEAQATGLPVLATTHADIPAQVLPGQSGFLSPENDPMALAQNMERFYRMGDDEYQGFSKAARGHVEHKFEIKSAAKKLLATYRAVL